MCANVVVNTLNLVRSCSCFAEYGKEMSEMDPARAARLFFPINPVVFGRCCFLSCSPKLPKCARGWCTGDSKARLLCWQPQSNCFNNRRKARENTRVQVAISFCFASHWLKKWREFCWPITERSNAKPKQTEFTFDAQLKTALFLFLLSSAYRAARGGVSPSTG